MGNELHEHYNGEDVHHDNMHPCDMHDDEEDQEYCHEAVNTCYMEHSEEGHEEMMASCIHQKCSLFFAEKPEKIEMLDGKSVDDACWEFVGALHEHYSEDDHHEEDDDRHPCDKYHHDNPEHLTVCYDALDECHIQYPEDEHMMGNCLYQKCHSFFDEYPEEVHNLEMGVNESCWSFLNELEEHYHKHDIPHHHDDDKPMKLNKHHPCTMMQSDHQEGCVDSYKSGLRKCKNDGDEKKCLEKQCKKGMKDSTKEWGMMYFENGDEIEDNKQFCKDFIKQHYKYEKKGGDDDGEEEVEKMSKHHPCQLMPEENRNDCAKDYEKIYEKCWGKDSSSKKMKKCLRKECEKKLVDDGEFDDSEAKELCVQMEKQSKKYQKKINQKN